MLEDTIDYDIIHTLSVAGNLPASATKNKMFVTRENRHAMYKAVERENFFFQKYSTSLVHVKE